MPSRYVGASSVHRRSAFGRAFESRSVLVMKARATGIALKIAPGTSIGCGTR